MNVLLDTLRLGIELTTSDPDWSRALATQEQMVRALVKVIIATRSPLYEERFRDLDEVRKEKNKSKSSEDNDQISSEGETADPVALKFDLLCLALGMVTNIVETVPEMKNHLLDMR
jgi:hypothetical protein